jgi:RNA-binding protein
MDKAILKELKKRANDLKPEFNLGKNGISDSFVNSVSNYLDVHEIVKIKVLIATNKDDVEKYSTQVEEKTNSTVLDKKGFTFTVYRKKE